MNATLMRSQTADMLQYLPSEELKTVNSLVKMLVRSWDPDFTKVTDEEAQKLKEADIQMANGEYYNENDVWN